MLIDMLHRGPSAKTIALLYAAVVVVAVLVVIAVMPTGRPESNAGDHRRLPEFASTKTRRVMETTSESCSG